jgi:signal transduction histidine kinase
MSTVEQKFHDEIELERMWITAKQGEYVVFTMLPACMLLLFGLWNTMDHAKLLWWFALLTVVNIFRWVVLRYFHKHKDVLQTNIRQFKLLMLSGSTLLGLCWMIGIMWFLVPSQPINIMLITVTLFIQMAGATTTWYCYWPAVVSITLPPSAWLIASILLQGDKIYIAIGLILSLLTILVVTTSRKLSAMLNHALYLNFENAALRKESEDKSVLLETVLENMDQGICMSDQDNRLRMWNEQFVKLLGDSGSLVSYNADLSILLTEAGASARFGSIVTSDVLQKKPDANEASNDASKVHSKYQLHNGQFYEVRKSELNQGGCVLTYTDITEQVSREKALEKARKAAEQANVAKTRFLAAASHDLRQPIHALGLFFAELSERVYNKETALVIGQIEDSISSINSMLNALLDISKLDAGVVKPNLEAFNLNDLFIRLKTDFQPIAMENNNDLRIRESIATVKTDPVMLERMLRNLIGNAIRYTENGRILVGIRQHKQHIEIQVIDNGIGIPKDQLDDIFIEFHQLQNPARDRRRGLGLGLAIVKRLANLLNHGIKVVSHFGRGSCFSIKLPLVEHSIINEVIKPTETTNRFNFSLIGRQILVLDDDVSVLEGMQGLLSFWGCQVICAGSPSEAVDKVAGGIQKPEVLIIDYRLTDNVSGIDVAINLQKRFGYPIPVLIITGDTGPDRLQEADASGFPLLHKPVQPAKLRSTLQYLLSKHNTTATNSS